MDTKKMMPHRSATLNDIAERAGVHRMAVSVVLNGSKSGTRVSETTRQRILEVAAELNYRPNAVARSLSRRSTHIFGFYSGYGFVDARNPFLAEITGGLLEGCARYRRDLLTHAIFRDGIIDDIYDELLSGKIDGLVVWAPPEDPLLARVRDVHLPVVAVTDAVPDVPSVVIDDALGSQLLVRHLADRGHRSVLYRAGPRKLDSNSRRQEAFCIAAAEAGMAVTLARPAGPGAQRMDAQEKALLFDGREGPTAVACWNDIAAHHFLASCRQMGVRVPEDLSVVGFDGITSDIVPYRNLTTIRAPWMEVATTAITHLATLLEGGEVPMQTILPVELILGETT